MPRRSPHRHTVSEHTRSGRLVRSYERGKGAKRDRSAPKRVVGRKPTTKMGVKSLAQELNRQLTEVVDVELKDYEMGYGPSVRFKSKSGERFMEDNVTISLANNFIIPTVDPWNKIIEGLANKKVILVEIWGKESTGLKDSDFKAVRKVVDAFAKKHDLPKVYWYGFDDGGYVLFDKKGRAVMTTYFGRHGMIELNEFGPATEDEFWKSGGSFLDWSSPNLKHYSKTWQS